MSFQTSALIVTWVALLLLALVVSGLVRQVHTLSSGAAGRRDPVGPRPGTAAPHLDRLDARPPAVLLFLRPSCHTCTDVLDESVSVAGTGLSVHAIYEGPAPDVPSGVAAHGHQGRLFATYDAVAVPFAVLVGGDGRVAGAGPVGSRAAIGELLAPVSSGGRS
ncbi:hypothetical protein [Actinophytocola sp.]|uniref:hypothetical protein n=1 Tax=Actinophytocola sp. TaxID=1872138 RepID=UPI003D6A579E